MTQLDAETNVLEECAWHNVGVSEIVVKWLLVQSYNFLPAQSSASGCYITQFVGYIRRYSPAQMPSKNVRASTVVQGEWWLNGCWCTSAVPGFDNCVFNNFIYLVHTQFMVPLLPDVCFRSMRIMRCIERGHKICDAIYSNQGNNGKANEGLTHWQTGRTLD